MEQEFTVKELAIGILVELIQKLPSILKNDNSIISKIFQLLMFHMISIEKEID